MRTCREVEVRGGACCLEKIGGAKEEADADKDFKDAGAVALRSRENCKDALVRTTVVPCVPE